MAVGQPAVRGQIQQHAPGHDPVGFLRPIGVQERVADSLHLSITPTGGTRDKAITQLTEVLWDRETGSHCG
jgi:hypothetical protein